MIIKVSSAKREVNAPGSIQIDFVKFAGVAEQTVFLSWQEAEQLYAALDEYLEMSP